MNLNHRLERLEARLGPRSGTEAPYAIFLCPLVPKGQASPGPAAALTVRGCMERREDEDADAFTSRVEATLRRRTA